MSDVSSTASAPTGQAPAPGAPAGGQAPPAPTNPPAGQAPPAPPAPTAPPAQGTPPEGQAPPAGGKTDAELAEARREAANYRRQLREAEEARDAALAANLTEAQRIEKERDDLKTRTETLAAQNRELVVNAALTAAAQAAGLRIQDTVEILGPKITLDADGKPTGVTEAVTALLTERPYLAVTGTPGQAGPGAAPGASGQPARYKRSQLADPSFYEEHRADIMKALQEGRIDEG